MTCASLVFRGMPTYDLHQHVMQLGGFCRPSWLWTSRMMITDDMKYDRRFFLPPGKTEISSNYLGEVAEPCLFRRHPHRCTVVSLSVRSFLVQLLFPGLWPILSDSSTRPMVLTYPSSETCCGVLRPGPQTSRNFTSEKRPHPDRKVRVTSSKRVRLGSSRRETNARFRSTGVTRRCSHALSISCHDFFFDWSRPNRTAE